MREVALAIDAYREALEHMQGTHAVVDCISALVSARMKIARECDSVAATDLPHRSGAHGAGRPWAAVLDHPVRLAGL